MMDSEVAETENALLAPDSLYYVLRGGWKTSLPRFFSHFAVYIGPALFQF